MVLVLVIFVDEVVVVLFIFLFEVCLFFCFVYKCVEIVEYY